MNANGERSATALGAPAARAAVGGWQPPALLRALRHRNYRLFFGGQIISVTGTWMQALAQSWLVYRLTGSAALLGLVGFAGQIPVFLLAPIGGLVADHGCRRRILVATQSAALVQALVLAALTLSGQVQLWQVFVLAAGLGVVNAVDLPTRQSFAVDLVGKADLPNAIALNSSVFNGARIVGPTLAGVLVAWVGEGWCFGLNAVSYVAVIVGLLGMRAVPRPEAPDEGSALGRLAGGFRYVWETRPVRAVLLLLAVVSLVGMPYAVLMPIFAKHILHGGPRGLGLLMGAAGVGAVAGALTMAARRDAQGLERWLPRAAAGFGLSLLAFAWSRSFWLSATLLVPAGFAMMLLMAAANTLIQTAVPDALRGRVMAMYAMVFMGVAPLGALLAGGLSDWWGAPGTVTAGAVTCLLAAAVFAGCRPTAERASVTG